MGKEEQTTRFSSWGPYVQFIVHKLSQYTESLENEQFDKCWKQLASYLATTCGAFTKEEYEECQKDLKDVGIKLDQYNNHTMQARNQRGAVINLGSIYWEMHLLSCKLNRISYKRGLIIPMDLDASDDDFLELV